MKKQVIEFNQAIRAGKDIPELQAGDVVKMYLKVKEGEKERIQIFEGLVIAIKGKQSSSPTLTVRKVSKGVGVEMIMPLYSEKLEKIELLKRAKVRRAKLYYVRGLTPKQSRMKYKDISDIIAPEEEIEETEVPSAEAPKEEESKKSEEKKKTTKVEAKKEENSPTGEEKKTEKTEKIEGAEKSAK